MAAEAELVEAISNICGHLTNRTAVLFLGAGINAGTTNNKGESFPLGADLSALICREFLGDPDLKIDLAEAAEISRFSRGARALNDYLFR